MSAGHYTRRPDIRGLATKAHVDELKRNPCQDCLGVFEPESMDWDHRPGVEKLGEIGKMVSGRYALSTVLAEIEKCDLVCSNCHRVRSKNRLNEDESFPSFVPFPKIPRLFRDVIITEKIDGCNAKILICRSGEIFAGGRNRWLMPKISKTGGPDPDQFGFAEWVAEREEDLWEELGVGLHAGEWFGHRINRGYGLDHRRFALFNPSVDWEPKHCHSVPILYEGPFDTDVVNRKVRELNDFGSVAVPGYRSPEGVMTYHTASRQIFKTTCLNDDQWKGAANEKR